MQKTEPNHNGKERRSLAWMEWLAIFTHPGLLLRRIPLTLALFLIILTAGIATQTFASVVSWYSFGAIDTLS